MIRHSAPPMVRAARHALPLASILVLVAGCGGDDGGGGDGGADEATSVPATSTEESSPDVLESEGVLRVRPVISLLPIDGIPLNPFGDDDPDEGLVTPNIDSTVAYDLGPAVADESDIATVVARQQAGEWVVEVTLTPEAQARVDDLAAICARERAACEWGQVAVTVDGFVLAGFEAAEEPVGPVIVLGGGLPGSINEAQATVIADALDPAEAAG